MADRKANTFRYINSREMTKKKKYIFSNVLWFSVEAERTTPRHFFFLFTSLKIFFAHFLPLKNTLGIVTEIHNIILYNSPLPEGNTF